MPSVTRHPTGQDLMCLVCGKQAQDIDHVINRGMGGSKERDVPENKVPLCRECHTAKTRGVLETGIVGLVSGNPIRLGEIMGYRWRRKSAGAPWITVPVEISQRYKCLVLSDGAEGEPAKGEEQAKVATSAPSPSTKEESDGEPISSTNRETATGRADEGDSDGAPVGVRDRGGVGDSDGGLFVDSTQLTHEQRVAIAQEIARSKRDHPWRAGDQANEWVAEFGEAAWQYIDTCPYECMEPPEPCPSLPHHHTALGYTIPALSNAMRVCERIPPPSRNGRLSHGHHTVVYTEDAEEREAWLERCIEEGWNVREFRRQVKGTKKKVKRYTVEQVEEYKLHHSNLEVCHDGVTTPCPYCPVIDELIRYLEEQA